MFLEIEGDVWVNVMLLSTVNMRHAKKLAVATSGANQFESAILYHYLMGHRELKVQVKAA